MAASDENNRGSVRERARLRATIADEPSSGYAYHDEVRVETLRGAPRVSRPTVDSTLPANDVGRSPRQKPTLMGGFAITSGDESGAVRTRPLDDDPLPDETPAEARDSEPHSLPPIPSVPPELEGTADARGTPFSTPESAARRALGFAPTDPPRASGTATAGIWEAVPSVMEGEPVDDGDDEPTHARESLAAIIGQEAPPRKSEADVKSLVRDVVGARISTEDASYADPRLVKLDRIVERGDWEQLAKEIAAMEQPSPLLSLLAVLARRELAQNDKAAVALNTEAIRSLARALGVPETSPTALMLGKRLLRRNRGVATVKPSTGLSIGVVLGGLAIGAGVGWLVTRLFL